ncbi:MAG: helicase-associated domain-containing protein [Nitrolancea sp.]
MRNLLGRLHDRAPHDLELIARWWEVEPGRRDRYALAGLLYRTMTDPWAFPLAWEQLSPFEQALLELLSADGSARTVTQLTAELGATHETVRGIVNRLFRIGFLFVEQEESEELDGRDAREIEYFLPRELTHLAARLQAERDVGIPADLDVTALLERLNDGALADIAEHMGRQIIPAVAMRSELIAQISPRLADPDHLRDTVRSLNPTVTRVWRALLERPESGSPSDLRGTLGMSHAELRMAAQTLARRGLLWRGYDDDGTLRLVIPNVLRHPRKVEAPTAPPLASVTVEQVEASERIFPYAPVWDLLTVLRAASNGLLVRRRGVLDGRASAMQRLARMIWRDSGDVPPTGYVQFLDFLGRGLGLFAQDGRGADTARANQWSRQGFARTLHEMTDVWRNATGWAEVVERDILQIWGGDWPGFRSRLLERLGELAVGTWVTLDSFAASFASKNPTALGAHFSAAMSHEAMPEAPDDRRRAVLQAAVETTVKTACLWLGIVELSASQRRTVLSLTDVGAWICGKQGEAPEVPELGSHPLTVQANFEILLPRPTPRRIWALSAFAETERLDRVTTYQLNRASIERGMSAGLSTSQIIGFLEQQGEEELPQNVAHEIESWARGFRRVLMRDGVLLDADDAESAANIARSLKESGFRVEALPRDRLLVTGHDGDEEDGLISMLEEKLHELGHTPLRPTT